MVEARTRLSAQLVIGAAVIVLGVLFTLDNLSLLESEPILRWWPAVLILIGLTKLVGFSNRPQMMAGGLFTTAGTLLLLGNLGILRVGLWELWPLALVVAGASLVLGSMGRQQEGGPSADPADYANAFVMMGGVGHKMISDRFRGGEATAFMGGVELDLRHAKPASDTVVLQVLAWWGGIDVFVPKDWKVTSEVLPIMAGYEDTTKVEADAKVQLIIKGLVVMGGVEVKN